MVNCGDGYITCDRIFEKGDSVSIITIPEMHQVYFQYTEKDSEDPLFTHTYFYRKSFKSDFVEEFNHNYEIFLAGIYGAVKDPNTISETILAFRGEI